MCHLCVCVCVCVCVWRPRALSSVYTSDWCRRWCVCATRGRDETQVDSLVHMYKYIYIYINNIMYMVHVGRCFVIRRVVRPLIKYRARNAAAASHRTRQLPFRRAFCASPDNYILLSPEPLACDVMSAARTGEYEIVCDSPVHVYIMTAATGHLSRCCTRAFTYYIVVMCRFSVYRLIGEPRKLKYLSI